MPGVSSTIDVQRKTPATIGISRFVIETGRPDVRLSKRAISVPYSSIRSASRLRHWPRLLPGNFDHGPVEKAFLDISTAWSTSAPLTECSLTGTSLPSLGFLRHNSGPVPDTHCIRSSQLSSRNLIKVGPTLLSMNACEGRSLIVNNLAMAGS